MRHRLRPRGQLVLRQLLPDRKSRFVLGFVTPPFVQRHLAGSPEVLSRPETAPPGAESLPTPELPPGVWFRNRWRMLPHRSTDKERGFGRESLATHTSAATSVSPGRGSRQMSGDTTPANHRAS